MRNSICLIVAFIVATTIGCTSTPGVQIAPRGETPQVTYVTSVKIGGEGAAEIVAYSPITKSLYVVNNSEDSRVDQVDVQDLNNPRVSGSIDITQYGGGVNSVAVYENYLAMAVEADDKQSPGSIVIYDIRTLEKIAVVPAGALPDMVTFSPDGRFVLSANEGEPNNEYTNDPEGSVTIVSTANWEATQVGFTAFSTNLTEQEAQGLRVFGPGASFAQDLEPEYIAVRDDSKVAYVVFQENNAFGIIDLETKTATAIHPFGFKDHSLAQNTFDPSDRDGRVQFGNWAVKGMYLPDAIDVVTINGVSYLFTANEGDSRDYDGFSEETRVKDLDLDEEAFPQASLLQADESLGRLKTTTTLGDTDGDGKFEEIYAYGGRSFSIWNADTGEQIYDSGDFIGRKIYEIAPSVFNLDDDTPDGRSDDKGTEPEAITLGLHRGHLLAFVGLERTSGLMVFDVSNPIRPDFSQWLYRSEDISPEGLYFVPAEKSHTGQALLFAGYEVSGTVGIFTVE